MLKYLLEYDVGTDIDNEDIMLESEIDINDRTILQEQINRTRKSFLELIKMSDSLRGEYIKSRAVMARINREYTLQYENKMARANARDQDIEYTNIKIKSEALAESIKTVDLELDFIKSDQRIINGSMYNRQ